jgi:hypothetical protein
MVEAMATVVRRVVVEQDRVPRLWMFPRRLSRVPVIELLLLRLPVRAGLDRSRNADVVMAIVRELLISAMVVVGKVMVAVREVTITAAIVIAVMVVMREAVIVVLVVDEMVLVVPVVVVFMGEVVIVVPTVMADVG